MTTRNPRRARLCPPRLRLAAILLLAAHSCCAAQDNGEKNSYPSGRGFGAANAGGTGLLPAGPPSPHGKSRTRYHRALNSYAPGSGFGAANAGGVGKLPRAPSAISNAVTSLKRRGKGSDAAAGGAATGDEAGGSSGDVGTGGTDGAGSR